MNKDQFTVVYDEAFDTDFCNNVIERFEKANELGFAYSRQKSENAKKHEKKDLQVFSVDELYLDMFGDLNKHFTKVFWETYYEDYNSRFSLDHHDPHQIYYNKIQKTSPSGGYHVWHCEDSARTAQGRILSYILYLNDVDEGGETEFLYQGIRVPAKAGRLAIFPAGFTHTHRGNPPLNEDKYILTGWVEM